MQQNPIFFHVVSPLGIDPYMDGGKLFTEACTVWLCAAFILFVYRHEAKALLHRLSASDESDDRTDYATGD